MFWLCESRVLCAKVHCADQTFKVQCLSGGNLSVHCCDDSSLCTAVQCASQLSISVWQLDALLTYPTDPLLPVQPSFLQNSFLVGHQVEWAPPQIGTSWCSLPTVLATLTQCSHLVRICVEYCTTCFLFIVITKFSSTFLNFPQPNTAFNGEFAQFTQV